MLARGATFKMKKDIPFYHSWHAGSKWHDARIGQHPIINNREIQVRMFVPGWRVLGFQDIDLFLQEVNRGEWVKV